MTLVSKRHGLTLGLLLICLVLPFQLAAFKVKETPTSLDLLVFSKPELWVTAQNTGLDTMGSMAQSTLSSEGYSECYLEAL